MLLKELFAGLASGDVTVPDSMRNHPSWNQEVTSLSTNSQTIDDGSLFIGMPGTRVDGGDFWESAIAKGAIAVLITPEALERKPNQQNALVLTAEDIPKVCAEVAVAFYHHPSQAMKMVGVTGTNGKTTTTHLIEYFLNQAEQKTAILGTLYTRWPGHEKTAVHTTPFSVDLQKELASAQQAGCQNAVMEISSHALAQKRAWGIPFEVSVFTNLTQDHLDYHKDLDDYFEAKALLFGPDYLKGRAVLNQADAYGQKLIARVGASQAWTYSLADSSANLYTKDLSYAPTGVSGILCTPAGEVAFSSSLVGQFNL